MELPLQFLFNTGPMECYKKKRWEQCKTCTQRQTNDVVVGAYILWLRKTLMGFKALSLGKIT